MLERRCRRGWSENVGDARRRSVVKLAWANAVGAFPRKFKVSAVSAPLLLPLPPSLSLSPSLVAGDIRAESSYTAAACMRQVIYLQGRRARASGSEWLFARFLRARARFLRILLCRHSSRKLGATSVYTSWREFAYDDTSYEGDEEGGRKGEADTNVQK